MKGYRLDTLRKKAEYEAFVNEWNKTHSISKAPSFSSWKQNYRK
jgi:hypothetical protein